ncbi:hypothetical protein KAW18_19080, partial [candidate division WOR-3 bacterium]|nr:hypothetical protein [candidate division WOR-3 bacterium]
MSKMKHAIIKRALKKFERVPRHNDLLWNEIFRHKSFTQASEQERKRIMFKSLEHRYLGEF